MAQSTDWQYGEEADLSRKVRILWNTTLEGTVVESTSDRLVRGRIARIVTVPVRDCTANYDILLNDEDGIDVAQGALMDRSNADTEVVYPTANIKGVQASVNGKLSIVVTPSESRMDPKYVGSSGKIIIYLRGGKRR